MPRDFVLGDSRTVRGPDGREHDVLDAINELPLEGAAVDVDAA